MYKSNLFLSILLILISKISSEEHELIYNEHIVYYDECRITVSPRNYLQPIHAFAQIQQPCNGTLLWTYPNLHLTLTIANLENDPFTICFEKKSIDDNHVRSIKHIDTKTNATSNMRELRVNSGMLLCSTSEGNRLSTIIEAQPFYAGVHLRYSMFNERHPWTNGPYPGWERSEKYLYGPQEQAPMKQKKIRRNRKKLH
ncbi:unnamed protein product [Adineta steineri]|uniref:Uncharacterized protein n=1 Tax=Adineta steineri TaxID=433720 RepID=A0A814BQA5_9BILA|nr:unnamed protein product [Adineta steineri]